ncbi:hypothetical protein PLICRDRAFT_42824 [Plicaturopsis crispa FD-325 SS-3]|nr:hypothetical protein PLICRDRAFT_42824 [Plicaturopsis crispa FD-325 SS-3]
MPFSFTFSLNVPGISNPFSQASGSGAPPPSNLPPLTERPVRTAITRRRPSPADLQESEPPMSRKRGWAPSVAETSQAATYNASTNGYLDTPARYRDMVRQAEDQERELEELMGELPPAKRRRTLAGSIVSTALSAALIGTAVGLSVYRLWVLSVNQQRSIIHSLSRWRDRGKESEQAPPPPYQERDWMQQPQKIEVTPPTPVRSRRIHHTSSAAAKRSAGARHGHRRTRTRTAIPSAYSPHRSISPTPGRLSAVQPEFDFGASQAQEEEPEDDQMDWIGDKLAMLIAEGQKALGREVVVASEAQEDEVDDGTDAWEEEELRQPMAGPSRSRSGSVRRSKHRPRDIAVPPAYSSPPPPLSSARSYHSQHSPARSMPATPRRMDDDRSSNISGSFREDEAAWESPELRESMSKARARYLANRR